MKRKLMRRSLSVSTALAALGITVVLSAGNSPAQTFSFSTGSPDGRIATASRPALGGKIEIETADDFILANGVSLTHGTFTGLLPAGVPLSSVTAVGVEIHRVFPNDSVNPPSGRVPTRVNSPSDVAFASRTLSGGDLTFTASLLSPSFTAANSVLNGINPIPNQTTQGEGPVTGQEVQFDFTFSTPVDLPADHYYFVPQVGLSSGDFYWLSAPKPTTPPFTPDLQTWIRNENLAPDWLRVGTDIVGGVPAPTYNASFSLAGETVPDSASTFGLLAFACIGLFAMGSRFPVCARQVSLNRRD